MLIIGKNYDEEDAEGSQTVDLCEQCEVRYNSTHIYIPEASNSNYPVWLERALGQKVMDPFWLDGPCDHPSYDEMEYQCAACGAALTQEVDG